MATIIRCGGGVFPMGDVIYSRISREDTAGWKTNCLSVGGLSSSATYIILYGCYISGNWGCECTCSAGRDGMGRNDGNAKTYFKKATGITSVSINFHPSHAADSMCYLEVIRLM